LAQTSTEHCNLASEVIALVYGNLEESFKIICDCVARSGSGSKRKTDLHLSEQQDPNPHQSEKQDPDPHQGDADPQHK
jgi:hypothetical protein